MYQPLKLLFDRHLRFTVFIEKHKDPMMYRYIYQPSTQFGSNLGHQLTSLQHHPLGTMSACRLILGGSPTYRGLAHQAEEKLDAKWDDGMILQLANEFYPSLS